jgi:hypothetical protein
VSVLSYSFGRSCSNVQITAPAKNLLPRSTKQVPSRRPSHRRPRHRHRPASDAPASAAPASSVAHLSCAHPWPRKYALQYIHTTVRFDHSIVTSSTASSKREATTKYKLTQTHLFRHSTAVLQELPSFWQLCQDQHHRADVVIEMDWSTLGAHAERSALAPRSCQSSCFVAIQPLHSTAGASSDLAGEYSEH